MLETIVALVVLGFLIVGLSKGVRFGLGARATERSMVARGEGLDAVDRTLRGLITRMDPGGFRTPPTLAGAADRMAFLTELPVGAAVDGIRRARVNISVDRKHQLILGWMIAPHAVALRVPPAGRVVLLRNVERLAIRYAEPAAKGGGWVRRWNSTDLPALVRLRIFFRSGDPRLWPDVVARPMRERPP